MVDHRRILESDDATDEWDSDRPDRTILCKVVNLVLQELFTMQGCRSPKVSNQGQATRALQIRARTSAQGRSSVLDQDPKEVDTEELFGRGLCEELLKEGGDDRIPVGTDGSGGGRRGHCEQKVGVRVMCGVCMCV